MNLSDIPEKIAELLIKHNLTNFQFDTECIFNPGDLSSLLGNIIKKTLINCDIGISETISADGQQYIATLWHKDRTLQVFADAYSDWLPDAFFMEMEEIPIFFETGLKYFSINPAIGLTGQDAWYFCGIEADLIAARKDGLPLIYPGESIVDSPEFKMYNP